jgi:hypothetical protein
VSYFDKGKYWEEAIKALEICAQQLRNVDYDYNQLIENLVCSDFVFFVTLLLLLLLFLSNSFVL